MMQALLKVFWDITLWRRGPRDIPASSALLCIVALVYLLTGAVQAVVIYGRALAFERALADLAATACFFGVCLLIARRAHRLTQTLTAVLATGVLLSLPMLGLLLLARQVGPDGPLALALQLILLPLQVWYLLVVGHIVRVALEAPLLTGMAVAMTYLLVNYLALLQLPQATAS